MTLGALSFVLFPIVMLICLIHVDEDYLTLTCVCINVQLILFIDNFEDIMPMNERPTTYLNEILNCRPPIFGYSKSPDSDSSDSVVKDDIDIPQRGHYYSAILPF